MPEASHYDVFGMRPTFEVDGAWLERQYRERALKLHPDRQAQASAQERRQALERTTALNEAYKVLRDEARRALYLLKLYGVDLEREGAGTRYPQPPELLEEVLALRESLDSAVEARALEKARALAADVEARRRAALAEAGGALRALEASPGNEARLNQATQALARVRYYTRFLERVEEFEESSTG